jgi:hypothetical protein
MAAMLLIRCNQPYREKNMNKKIVVSIFAILIFLSLCIYIPDMMTYRDKLTGIGQKNETKLVQNNPEKNVSVSEAAQEKPVDSQTIKEKERPPAPQVNPETVKTQTVIENSSQNKISSPSSGSTSKNSDISNNASGSNPGNNAGSANPGYNQVSRGESAVDNSKYPLLSKVNGSFGQFRYRNLSGGRIEVDPQWVAQNIVTITLPGLNRQVQVHKNAADHFITAFNYIKNGTAVVNGKEVSLLSLIKTMDGTYVTRHVNWDPARGLSNHSWGTAIDINASGHFGYVDPQKDVDDPNLILWEKAFKPAGFSWGNRYSDSMHYELIK